MQLERGEQIGAFEVEGLVGTGGMAEVWAVRHTLLGSRHALKIFFEESPRIHREARVMAALSHDNLLAVEDLLTIGGRSALLMPLIEGPSLEALMRSHRLSRGEALALTLQITEGLIAAHAAGLVHRDLKPANILIDLTDTRLVPRVMDFGLVKADDDDIETRAGMAMGTPAYAAPEQLVDARLADTRADLWSLGVILCELLTGGRPFAGRSLLEVSRRHAEPPSLATVPEDIRPIIEGLLQTDPAHRTPSAEALRDALAPLVDSDPLTGSGPLAAAIWQAMPDPASGSDSMNSLWTWGAGADDSDEDPPTSTIAPAEPGPVVTGTPWTDRYVLEQELGRGGMAVVWRAWDQRLGAWRAIKILQPQLTSTAVRRRFELEARTMARLAHRGIVTVHDISEHTGQLFIVMEWLSGGTLADRVKRFDALSPRQAVAVIGEILDALAVAHAAGIVHRDVKPSNILLDGEGRPALTDFGIARVGASEVGLTRTGMALGTLTYMAPEQRVDARSVDHRADLYAVGATLWTTLTGRSPLLFVAPESRDELFTAVPQPLAEIIQTATRYRPEDRYADAAAMLAALHAVLPLLPEDDETTTPINPEGERAWMPAITAEPISSGEETWSGEVAETDLLTEAPEPEIPGLTVETPAVLEPFPASPPPTVDVAALAAEPTAPTIPKRPRSWAPVAAVVGLVGLGVVGLPVLLSPPVEPMVEPAEPPVEEPPAEVPAETPAEAPEEAPAETSAETSEEAPAVEAPPPKPREVRPPVEDPPAEAPPEEPPAEEAPAEEPPPTPSARILVTGEGENIRLIDATGGTHAPGAVPPGVYTLRVWFPNRHTTGELTVEVADGQRTTIHCAESFGMCTAQGG